MLSLALASRKVRHRGTPPVYSDDDCLAYRVTKSGFAEVKLRIQYSKWCFPGCEPDSPSVTQEIQTKLSSKVRLEVEIQAQRIQVTVEKH